MTTRYIKDSPPETMTTRPMKYSFSRDDDNTLHEGFAMTHFNDNSSNEGFDTRNNDDSLHDGFSNRNNDNSFHKDNQWRGSRICHDSFHEGFATINNDDLFHEGFATRDNDDSFYEGFATRNNDDSSHEGFDTKNNDDPSNEGFDTRNNDDLFHKGFANRNNDHSFHEGLPTSLNFRSLRSQKAYILLVSTRHVLNCFDRILLTRSKTIYGGVQWSSTFKLPSKFQIRAVCLPTYLKKNLRIKSNIVQSFGGKRFLAIHNFNSCGLGVSIFTNSDLADGAFFDLYEEEGEEHCEEMLEL
ncbi:hypothetical protein M9H77_09543 [Catharanthus roseus]|uniref:Uncharacterized protein n=1 Tax=Catharanthus roseus TaxID=4058 RepID=A0ACC0C0V0_CATRO|nr:hypothetical protein M9H77_09543 [Catharanthus roseus]